MQKTNKNRFYEILMPIFGALVLVMLLSFSLANIAADNYGLAVSCLILAALATLIGVVFFAAGFFSLGRDYQAQGGVTFKAAKYWLSSFVALVMAYKFYSAYKASGFVIF